MERRKVHESSPSPKRDGVCYGWREGKCTKGDQCKFKNQQTPKHPLQRLTPSNRQRRTPSPKQLLQQLCAKHAEESEAEVETVYHDRDAEDAMSESSRWSGETEIPEKYVWFQEILDNDVIEEVEYLKNKDEQWRNNSMWYKGFYKDISQTSSKPVDAKTFKTDHRRHLASSRKKHSSEPRRSEAANDIYRTHKMPMNFTFEYDKEDDEIMEGVVQWKRKHGQPISLFALSANQCKGVEWTQGVVMI